MLQSAPSTRKRSASASPPIVNRLLRSLPRSDYTILTADLKSVCLTAGQILTEPLKQSSHFYFPETAVCALITVMSDDRAVEAASVGNEGVAGLSSFLGSGAMTTRCITRIAGDAQQITSIALVRALRASPALAATFRRYTQAFINQIAQSIACQSLHTVEQRCAQWLLMTHDRMGRAKSIFVTQQFLADILGVRREAVSEAASRLQSSGAIRYTRGHLSVLDRAVLEVAACECYAATRADYDRLFPVKIS